jgi:hypothetical protein
MLYTEDVGVPNIMVKRTLANAAELPGYYSSFWFHARVARRSLAGPRAAKHVSRYED